MVPDLLTEFTKNYINNIMPLLVCYPVLIVVYNSLHNKLKCPVHIHASACQQLIKVKSDPHVQLQLVIDEVNNCTDNSKVFVQGFI